jgi:hypothetical protein
MPRDFQRARVYRFDDAVKQLYPAAELTLDQCQELVKAAYRGHRGCPTVKDGRGRRCPCGSIHVIKLPRFARTAHMVMHECAHGMTELGHGSEFVAKYIELLVKHVGLDHGELIRVADDLKVQVQQ